MRTTAVATKIQTSLKGLLLTECSADFFRTGLARSAIDTPTCAAAAAVMAG